MGKARVRDQVKGCGHDPDWPVAYREAVENVREGWCWFSVSESTAEVLGTSCVGVDRDGQCLNQVLSPFPRTSEPGYNSAFGHDRGHID